MACSAEQVYFIVNVKPTPSAPASEWYTKTIMRSRFCTLHIHNIHYITVQTPEDPFAFASPTRHERSVWSLLPDTSTSLAASCARQHTELLCPGRAEIITPARKSQMLSAPPGPVAAWSPSPSCCSSAKEQPKTAYAPF